MGELVGAAAVGDQPSPQPLRALFNSHVGIWFPSNNQLEGREQMKTARTLLAAAALVVLGGYGVERNDGMGISAAAALDPPTCTNGDCSGPPVCTNGDCGPAELYQRRLR